MHLNPLFPAAAFIEPGVVVTMNDLVPQDEMIETRFFKEWVAPQGIVDALAVVLERDAATAAFFGIRRSEKQGVFNDEARRRSALIVPHLQRAVAIGRLVDQSKATEAVLMGTLDQMETGVYLVDAGGRIAFANAPGQAMLDEGKILARRNDALMAIRFGGKPFSQALPRRNRDDGRFCAR